MDWLDVGMWSKCLQRDDEDRDKHMSSMDEIVRQFPGPGYSESGDPRDYLPENHYFSYITRTIPSMIFSNPESAVTTRKPGTQAFTARAIKHGLDRWVKDENLVAIGELAAMDVCVAFSVLMVTEEPDRFQGLTKDRALFKDGKLTEAVDGMRPRVYRVPQRMFFCDSRAVTFESAEYMGHAWFASASELEEEMDNGDGDWEPGVLEQILSDYSGTVDAASKVDPEREDSHESIDEPQVEFRDVWIPGLQTDGKGPDTGHNGSILTLAMGDSTGSSYDCLVAKAPRPYFGPASGPYAVHGSYVVPNKLWRLSPLAAVFGHVKEVNALAQRISEANKSYKRVLLTDSKNKKDADRIRNARHDFIIPVTGMEKDKIIPAEYGGASPMQYQSLFHAKGQLQQDSAMNDAQNGEVTGVGTATENEIANESTQARLGKIVEGFRCHIASVLEKAGHYLYHSNKVLLPLGKEAAEEFGMIEPWLEGGDFDADSGATYADLEITIELNSMGRQDPTKRKQEFAMAHEYAMTTAPMRPQFPFWDWDTWDELAAEVTGVKQLASLFDNEAARQMQPFEQGAQVSQPRLSADPVGPQRPAIRSAPPRRKEADMPALGMPKQPMGAQPLQGAP